MCVSVGRLVPTSGGWVGVRVLSSPVEGRGVSGMSRVVGGEGYRSLPHFRKKKVKRRRGAGSPIICRFVGSRTKEVYWSRTARGSDRGLRVAVTYLIQ